VRSRFLIYQKPRPKPRPISFVGRRIDRLCKIEGAWKLAKRGDFARAKRALGERT